MKYTAELHNWMRYKIGDYSIIQGDIYGDVKGRFRDGTNVHTSVVLEDHGDYVVTRNSTYKLVGEEKK